MQPVIYNTADDAIVREMQNAGLYDTFREQIARVPPAPRQIFVFKDSTPARLTYYIYHRGFLLESDNGFSAITLLNPSSTPQIARVIEQSVMELFDSEAKILWLEDPQRRN
ncbi:MAG: hypothetical protein KJ077_11790 [Anaerolineae bacterium]|nr:hypothetical protein [Anaerolineae bacterium]